MSRQGWLSQRASVVSSGRARSLRAAKVRRRARRSMRPAIRREACTASSQARSRVSVAQGERGPYFAHFFGPGDWFGEGPAISGRARIVGLCAARDTELLHLSLRSVDEILREQPASWRIFAALTLGKLEAAMWAIDDLMMRDSLKRFVAVLLRLGGCRAVTPPGGVPIAVHVSQDDLAAMANVSRSTANAILRQLEAAGHVAQSYRQIGIVSPDGLRSMLGE